MMHILAHINVFLESSWAPVSLPFRLTHTNDLVIIVTIIVIDWLTLGVNGQKIKAIVQVALSLLKLNEHLMIKGGVYLNV